MINLKEASQRQFSLRRSFGGARASWEIVAAEISRADFSEQSKRPMPKKGRLKVWDALLSSYRINSRDTTWR